MTIINMSKFLPFFQQQPAWVSPVLAHWPHLRPQVLASLEIGSLIFPQLQEPTEMRQLCRVWWSQLMRRPPQPGRMVPLSASVQARPVPIITCLPPIQTKLVTTVLTGRAPQPIVVLYWKNLGIVNICVCVVWFRLLCWFFFSPSNHIYTIFPFPSIKGHKRRAPLLFDKSSAAFFVESEKKISLIHLFYNCSTTYYKFSLCVYVCVFG